MIGNTTIFVPNQLKKITQFTIHHKVVLIIFLKKTLPFDYDMVTRKTVVLVLLMDNFNMEIIYGTQHSLYIISTRRNKNEESRKIH